MHDPITQQCVDALLKQREKGLVKYGVGLEDFKGSLSELASHAVEEAADQLAYLTELKKRVDGIVGKLETLKGAMETTLRVVGESDDAHNIRMDIRHLNDIIASLK